MDLRPETEPRLEMVVKPVRSTGRRILVALSLVLLLLVAGVLTLLFVGGGATPQVAFLPDGYWKHPTGFQRVATQIRGFFSLAPQVRIHAEAFKTKKLGDFELAAQILERSAFVKTNGTAAWVLNEEDWERFQKGVGPLEKGERLFSPKITTVESMEGTMFAGNTVPIDGKNIEVGLNMNLLPERVAKTAVRLAYSFVFTEFKTNQIQTNASFVLRARVPNRGRVLVLQQREGQEQPMCVLVTVVALPGK